MKTLLKILIGLVAVVAVVVAILLVVISRQPSDFRIERTEVVAAGPEVVFAQVNDFHKWPAWNPWDDEDPTQKLSYGGAAAGVGASYAYEGDQVGAGRMTIVESRPGELVKIKQEFLKPFTATNTAEFVFKPQANGQTEVTWAMYGEQNFMGKAVNFVMDCDKMIGGQFEKGLASMKQVSEGAAKGN